MSVDLTAANNLPPGADELFRIFARFEFALKMVGYAKMSGSIVNILWNDFANSKPIGETFFAQVSGSGICPLLLTDPPKADRIENGHYDFEDQAKKPETAAELLLMVRRVRNNLFHGGKYFDDNVERNRRGGRPQQRIRRCDAGGRRCWNRRRSRSAWFRTTARPNWVFSLAAPRTASHRHFEEDQGGRSRPGPLRIAAARRFIASARLRSSLERGAEPLNTRVATPERAGRPDRPSSPRQRHTCLVDGKSFTPPTAR
ncbi:hypothetical protein [Rhizobium sp. BK251]|uniref:hypothetical protein n=1 Tax=Rhizobium sp. BK251 TaxID=2512125 RepID=UPI00104BC2EF|nr:hypothetical protein [Rhizobium sp. BK251]TCL62527.1 hypothetical protein EV286_12017 [Rhizobium sp. BK251]